jgi:hypothetical protein
MLCGPMLRSTASRRTVAFVGAARVGVGRLGRSPAVWLSGIVVALLTAHLLLVDRLPERKLFGDEYPYTAQAIHHADEGWWTLLPGNLEFATRPPLWGHVLSRVVDAEGTTKPIRAVILRNGSPLQAALLAVAVIALYVQGRLLGLGPFLSLLPPLLLSLLPRTIFHVHSLWSEPLHMALQEVAFACVLAVLVGRSPLLLAPAGLTLGLAILTRTTTLFFLPVIPAVVAATYWLKARRSGGGASWLRQTAIATFVFALALAATVVPQLRANAERGHGYRIAANSWINVALGIEPSKGDAHGRALWRSAGKRASSRDFALADKQLRRELKARAQVLDYLEHQDLGTVLTRQIRRANNMLLFGRSNLEFAVANSVFGQNTPRFSPAVALDRAVWPAVVGLGLLGLLIRLRSGPGWVLLALYAGYFLIAFLAAPIASRMTFQLTSALVLGCGGLLASTAHVMRRALRPDKARTRA